MSNMSPLTTDGTRLEFYDRIFKDLTESGLSASAAAEAIAERFLDGKPRTLRKNKLTSAERDRAFWFSEFLEGLSAQVWRTEPFVLALARYLGQERISNLELLAHVATLAPDTVHRAVRYSGLVLKQNSPRRMELVHLANVSPNEFGELLQVLDIFEHAYRDRLLLVDQWRGVLADLSPLEMLLYASLYAFEHLVPHKLVSVAPQESAGSDTQNAWDAINDILIWKLATASEKTANVTESRLGRALAVHLSPFLFHGATEVSPRHDLREAFENLMAAQVELNEFLSRSADAYSYDDGIRFVRNGDTLEIVEHDPVEIAQWVRNGRRLERLQGYWFLRAASEFAVSELAGKMIGRAENHEDNRRAYILAMRSRLQLVEVYGLGEAVTLDSGEPVDLFQALLSMQLMTAFYNIHFLQSFAVNCSETGNWLEALARLAMDGVVDGRQNRFPLVWSERAEKIRRITGWTVTPKCPAGSPRMAAAILDFWTID